MAADIVPVKLALTDGDLYTLWAPRWRDAGDEWEALLGKDDDLYAFASVPDLVAFVRTNTDNDLVDHPSWQTLTAVSAHQLDPDEDNQFDLIGVPDLLAEKPTDDSVAAVHAALVIAASIGTVCELPAVTKFFNGNPQLSTLAGGAEYFASKSGLKRWHDIGVTIDKGWDGVLDAIDAIVATPEVDAEVAREAEAELLAPEENELVDQDVEGDITGTTDEEPDDTEAAAGEAAAEAVILGADEDFWIKVGIDRVRMITSVGTYYTLRCYLDDEPRFLGRNGRVSVFTSERALARYLADEHDHDLSNLRTYDDIRTAATDGSLRIDITDDNVYVLTGLADDIADGPDAIDADQLDLAVELLRDVGEYAADSTIEDTIDGDTPLGRLVTYVLEPGTVAKPTPPYADALDEWTRLEGFLESRLRQE